MVRTKKTPTAMYRYGSWTYVHFLRVPTHTKIHTPSLRSVQKAVKAAKQVVKDAKKGAGGGGGLIHTGKLKVPFKPASKSVAVLKKGKKGLIKQLKRR